MLSTQKETMMPSQRVCRLVKWSVLSMTLGAFLSAPAVRSAAQVPDLGIDASLHGKKIFPAGDPWNQDISASAVDLNSSNLIASMGFTTSLHPDFGTTYQGAPIGFDYEIVPGTQALV